jgi:hypothetical protein
MSEAHIVYTLNKTGQWLHEHDEKQVMELIKWSKQQLKSVIDTENKRLRELDAQLTQIRIDKEKVYQRLYSRTYSSQNVPLFGRTSGSWSDVRVYIERCFLHFSR